MALGVSMAEPCQSSVSALATANLPWGELANARSRWGIKAALMKYEQQTTNLRTNTCGPFQCLKQQFAFSSRCYEGCSKPRQDERIAKHDSSQSDPNWVSWHACQHQQTSRNSTNEFTLYLHTSNLITAHYSFYRLWYSTQKDKNVFRASTIDKIWLYFNWGWHWNHSVSNIAIQGATQSSYSV